MSHLSRIQAGKDPPLLCLQPLYFKHGPSLVIFYSFSPWINGCVGFYNRKPFILMNFYTTLITFLNILAFLFSISTFIKRFENLNSSLILHLLIIMVALVLNCIIFVTILLFLKFHIDLILRNYTTLETL